MKTPLSVLIGLLICTQTWASDNKTHTRPFSKLHTSQQKEKLIEKTLRTNSPQNYATQNLLPDTIKMYEYDNAKWTLYDTEIRVYDKDDQLTEIIGTIEKILYKYDANGETIEKITQAKIGGTFVNSEKKNYGYDTLLTDYVIESIKYSWDKNAWVNVYQHKKIIDWNANKNANSEITLLKDGDTFINVEKIEIMYDANQKASSVTPFSWNYKENTWNKGDAYMNMVWHTWGGNFLKDLFYGKNKLASARLIASEDENSTADLNAVYTDTGFISTITVEGEYQEALAYTSFDKRGSYEESISFYPFAETEYVLQEGEKVREMVDEHGTMISSESFYYDPEQGIWVIAEALYIPCIYDDLGRITQMTILIGLMDEESGEFSIDTAERWEYFYKGGVSIEKTQNTNTHLSVYPNPGKDYFQLQGNQAIKELSIYTIGGQQVRCLKNIAPAQKVDISNLPKGVYIISAKGDQTIETMRWIKM